MKAKEERRVHARVETDLEVSLRLEDGEEREQLANLSKGGALVRARHLRPGPGTELALDIPVPGSKTTFSILAQVVRVVEATDPVRLDPVLEIHLRFTSVDPAQQEELEGLIDAFLGASGILGREAPRVFRRFIVEFDDRAELERVYAEDISRGGLAIAVESDGVQQGEQVHFVVVHPDSGDRLDHTARVVYVRQGEDGGRRVGLELDPLGDKAEVWEMFIHSLF